MIYNQYSENIKDAVSITKDFSLLKNTNIPRSTANYWSNRSTKIDNENEIHLRSRIHELEQELRKKDLKLNALKVVFDEFVPDPGRKSISKAKSKKRILNAIDKARELVRLNELTQLTGITKGRYLRWKNRNFKCCLDDYSRCPKTFPMQLTKTEVSTMERLFHDPSLSHYSLPSLCLYAKKTKQLFCSPEVWRKYRRKMGWVRPGRKIYPKSRKIGIRASKPNELWHMDLSVYRLPEGQKVYIQAIIDNYSKYIIGYHVSDRRRSIESVRLLKKSLAKFKQQENMPTLFVDDGSENRNKKVSNILKKNNMEQVFAQIDVSFSNSKIEAFFRDLKNNYLYKKKIKTIGDLKSYLDFYIDEYNNKIPQQFFGGGTPKQIYKGQWNQKNIDRLSDQVHRAKMKRIRTNKSLHCNVIELNENFVKLGL